MKSDEKMNTKFKIVLIAVIVGSLIMGSLFGILLSPSSSNSVHKKILLPKSKVKITKNEASNISYETFDNRLISLKIPKGWKVEVPKLDYIHYSFKVYNPKNPNYMFLFAMKFEGFNKSENARNWQKKYYPNVVFAKLPAIDPQTTESFYKVWNETANYVNTVNVKSDYLPTLNDFTIIENLGTNPIGGDILRATYTNDNKKNQGLFTASVKSIGTYYVSSNIMNLSSERIDVSPLNVYNVILMTTPENEFNDWQDILDHCLSTLKFSQTFVDGFNKEEKSIMDNFKANQQVYNSVSDSIMSSWEKRNNSYDIMSQKQSDATLGYERVYDTDTGEIYKAYNGFMDDYDGNKYKPITDDMYNKKTSGYIEK